MIDKIKYIGLIILLHWTSKYSKLKTPTQTKIMKCLYIGLTNAWEVLFIFRET